MNDQRMVPMKRLLTFCAVLVTLLLACCFAQAENTLTLIPEAMKTAYCAEIPGETFVVITYRTPYEKGCFTDYAPDGAFSGEIALTSSGEGGNVYVEVQSLMGKVLAKQQVNLPQAEGFAKPQGNSNVRVREFTLTETPEGFDYAFTAEGADYMVLDCHSRQEDRSVVAYPVDDAGHFAGSVTMPLTYARTQMTIRVETGTGAKKAEAICYKGYEAPEAPEQTPGRLSGVIVCIDPGHQENGKAVSEPKGPGLDGYGGGTDVGMAMGNHTLRREHIVVLEISMKLRDVLLSQGATVLMTRTEVDVFLTNQERAAVANDAGAHVYLRIHADYANSPDRWGMSVYCPRNSDYAKAVAAPETYAHMGQIILDHMKQAVGYDISNDSGRVTVTDQFIGNNWAKPACFLVETGYMSNREEDLKLAHPAYQQMIAAGLADGVYALALDRGWIAAGE